MRHGIAGNRLNSNRSLRKATLRDIAKATLIHQRVCTTLAKAKEARKLVDQLITLGKKGELVHRRRAFAILCDHQMVSDLFNKTSPRFKNRIGGYTRIIPAAGLRRGDNAQLAYLELTEKDKVIISNSRPEKKIKSKTVDTDAQKPAKAEHPPEKHEPVEKTKPALPHAHPPQEDKGKIKGSVAKNFTGGIKNIFRKKPSE